MWRRRDFVSPLGDVVDAGGRAEELIGHDLAVGRALWAADSGILSRCLERIASGDSRLSLEERYANAADFAAKRKAAADQLVQQRLLLPEDATTIEAEPPGIGT